MKSTRTISDVTLTYKKTQLPTEKIITSQNAAELARKTIPDDQIAHKEFFGVLLLNRANRVMQRSIVSTGGLNSCIVDPKHIFQYTLLSNASGLIIFHNHPSGDAKPSEQDLRITKRIKEGCNLLDITLLDHVILSAYEDSTPNYYSFADEGLV